MRRIQIKEEKMTSQYVCEFNDPKIVKNSDTAVEIRIILGDCFEKIKKIEDASIDFIATDPPYGINFEKKEWDRKGIINWEVLAKEFKRILKPNKNLVLFQGWSEIMETKYAFDKYFELKNWIIYDRIKGRGAKRNLVSTREDILWYVNAETYPYNKVPSKIKKKTGGTIGRKNGNAYRALSNVWTDISPIVPWSPERVAHPTQKPVEIMDRILTLFSNKGDLVLDPFMGSGTTGVSCAKLKRNFLGIEKEEKYYNLACERLNYNNEQI